MPPGDRLPHRVRSAKGADHEAFVYWPGLLLGTLLLFGLVAAAGLIAPIGAESLRQPPPPIGSAPLAGRAATTATALPCGGDAISNGGFETGNLGSWVISGSQPPPFATDARAHSGTYSALLGNTVTLGESAIFQQIVVPPGSSTLSFRYWPTSDGFNDWQAAYIRSPTPGGAILATIMQVNQSNPSWYPVTYNMAPFARQTVWLEFRVHQVLNLHPTRMYVDDVTLTCATPAATPTSASTATPTATSTATVTTTATRTATPTGTATRTPTTCPGGTGWQIVAPALIGGSSDQLAAVAVAGANDGWAVGARGAATPTASTTATTTATASSPALIEHWNGSTWASVPNPTPGTLSNALLSVAVVGSNDVWAVGSYSNEGGYNRTLTEHWDGSAWSVVSSPSPGAGDSVLTGVAAAGPNDVWAVGYQYPTVSGFAQTLILHWDGSAWTQVASPNGGTRDNFLAGVAVGGASDVWAVGNYVTNLNVAQTLVLHWNGSAWSTVASPNAGSQTNNYLAGVAAGGPGAAWAVGYYVSGGVRFTLVLQWTGTSWALVGSPSPGSADNRLTGVAVVSPTDVWAVGYTRQSGSGTVPRTLIEHWDGTAWSVVASPNAHAGTNQLAGLAVVATNDIWAVGSSMDPTELSPRSLILHYACLPPTVTPTATAGPPSATATASPTASPSSTVTPTPVATLTPP